MKKNILLIMTTAAAVVLTACGAKVPALSKLDNNKAAEYMAGEMLKNDEDYAYALDYDRSVLYATPTPAPTAVPTPSPKGEENKGNGKSGQSGQGGGTSASGGGSGSGSSAEEAPEMQEVSLSDVYGLKNVTIEMTSSALQKSYGEGHESYVASSGKNLLIVYFKVKNTADADRKVNLSDHAAKYQLNIGDNTVSPLRSMARGDLQYFKSKISAGKSEQGILLFEVDKDASVNGSSLVVMNGMKQATVSLK